MSNTVCTHPSRADNRPMTTFSPTLVDSLAPAAHDIPMAGVLRARRLSRGISLEQLSESTGTAVSVIRRIEAAEVEVDLAYLAMAALALDCDCAQLVKKAEILAIDTGSVKLAMLARIAKTLAQLNRIERQQERMLAQVIRMRQQVINLRRAGPVENRRFNNISEYLGEVNTTATPPQRSIAACARSLRRKRTLYAQRRTQLFKNYRTSCFSTGLTRGAGSGSLSRATSLKSARRICSA